MRLREIRDILSVYKDNIRFTNLANSPIENTKPQKINVQGLIKFREAINAIESIPVFTEKIKQLKQYSTFYFPDDSLDIVADEVNYLRRETNELSDQVETVYSFLNTILPPESATIISVKIPESIDTFDESVKFFKDLKVAIENPINRLELEGTVKIENTDLGSIWYDISLGYAAMNLVALLVTSGIVIYNEIQRSIILKSSVERYEIGTEMIKKIEEKVESSLHLMTVTEANYVLSETDKEKADNQEILKTLTESIKTFSNLILNGAEIHPSLKSPHEVREKFPDWKAKQLVQSHTKQITSGNSESNVEE